MRRVPVAQRRSTFNSSRRKGICAGIPLGNFLPWRFPWMILRPKRVIPRLRLVAEALDAANAAYLEHNKSPSRRVNELDNRGSHYYLARYWAEALAAQQNDGDLAARFAPVAAKLRDNEAAIVAELEAAQGAPVDVGGYYNPDESRASDAMRPSATLNGIIDAA